MTLPDDSTGNAIAVTGRARLWRNADFVRLWVAQTVSQVGSRVSRDAIPITAVLLLHASPSATGLLAMAGAAPAILFGLIAGAWVDRLRRRRVMIAMDLMRAVVLGVIPVAALCGLLEYWLLCVVAFIAATGTLLFDAADRALLPSVVSHDDLLEANSLLGVSSSLAEVGGPALTGGLVQLLAAPIAIAADAFSFLASALALALMKTHEAVAPPDANRSMRLEVADGLRWIAGQPLLRSVIASTGIFSLFGGFFGALYWIFTLRTLGLTPGVMGLLVALGGVGALAGAAIAPRTSRRFGIGPTLIGSLALAGLVNLLLLRAEGAAVTSIAIVGTVQLVGDFLLAHFFVNEATLQQLMTPASLLGRTAATTSLLNGACNLAGLAAGGVLGDALGVRPALAIGALGILTSALLLMVTPLWRLREHDASAALDS